MLAQPDVDAVLVSNPHALHAPTALAAIAAGKHVLLEKPMCLSLIEADALIAAQGRAGVIVQVGYMRRYAPAFAEACRLVREMTNIRLARVHDVIGRNALIIRDTSRVIRPIDLSPASADELTALQTRAVTEAIGPASPHLASAYVMMLGLVSHDVSAMREMLGMPRAVLYAAHRAEGRFVTAAFDYNDYVCQLEVGVDMVPRFDAYLEVYGGERVVRVDYDTPYVRNIPASLTVTDAQNEVGLSTTTSFPTRMDSFVVEWQAFHANVTSRIKPKTSLEDSRNDLVLFRDLVAAIRRNDVAV